MARSKLNSHSSRAVVFVLPVVSAQSMSWVVNFTLPVLFNDAVNRYSSALGCGHVAGSCVPGNDKLDLIKCAIFLD